MRLGLAVVVVIVFAAVLEGGHALVRHVPIFQRSGPLLQTARLLYLEHRSTIQFSLDCARFDPRTSYLLRPGSCRFANDEFETTYHVNSEGLRDDESSLEKPEVVVLGDSYAMGWGVEQDETFPALLERATGLNVLNAAISSYGTVRQMRILERVDTSAMRYLVIQYAGNDLQENEAYLLGGNDLETMNEQAYDALVRQHAERGRYYPGAYFATRIRAHRSGMKVGRPGGTRGAGPVPSPSRAPASPRIGGHLGPEVDLEVRAFLNVLNTSPVDLEGVRIVVVAIATSPQFVEGVNRALESGGVGWLAGAVIASDPAFLLTENEFFRLDDHLRADGHAIIAEHVRELMAVPIVPAPQG